MLCKLLVFCAWTTIVGVWIDANTATWGEDTRHLYIFRIHEADKVFHNDIDTILMEITMIAEREEIEFQTLALHHLHIWHILYLYLCKVWLSGNRTERCELRAVEQYPVVILRMLVLKCLKYLWSIVLTVFSLLTKRLKVIIFAICHKHSIENYYTLHIENLKDVIFLPCVIYIFLFMFLHPSYDTYSNRKHDNLIDSLQAHLSKHKPRELVRRDYSA